MTPTTRLPVAELDPDSSCDAITDWLDGLPAGWRATLDARLLAVLAEQPNVSYRTLGSLLGFGPLVNREWLAQLIVWPLVRSGRLTYVRGKGGRPNRYTVHPERQAAR